MKPKKKIYILLTLIFLVIAVIIFFIKLQYNSKNIVVSVKDSLSKKMSLSCEFKDEEGILTKSYIKNGAIRVSSGDEIIMKDKKMYIWKNSTKSGFVYSIPESGDSSNSDLSQGENYLDIVERYKDSCKSVTVDDSYFAPPTDVYFQDMSKLLEEMKKQIPQSNILVQ